MTTRNRIKAHVRLRAGDLVPHEMNPRTHNDAQRDALAALYASIGFARSLLAYELPDGRLKLIDGHLRASLDPDQEVEVEVLDVNDDEARQLLLSIDPLAQLAGYSDDTLNALRAVTTAPSDAVANLWNSINAASLATQEALKQTRKRKESQIVEQFLVIIECQNEREQVDLLRRFKSEGLQCTAKMC